MSKRAETQTPIHPLMAERWSPRALDETAEVRPEQLVSLLEAARWAASYGNTQPARYLVGRRGEASFDRILGTLNDGNKAWAHRAGALLIGVAVTRNEKGDVPYAEYGLGLASQNLALQAVAEGLVVHQMAGFDPHAARREFELPDDAEPLVAIAVGTLAEPEVLGDDWRIERERAPRARIPLADFAFSDRWGSSAV